MIQQNTRAQHFLQQNRQRPPLCSPPSPPPPLCSALLAVFWNWYRLRKFLFFLLNHAGRAWSKAAILLPMATCKAVSLVGQMLFGPSLSTSPDLRKAPRISGLSRTMNNPIDLSCSSSTSVSNASSALPIKERKGEYIRRWPTGGVTLTNLASIFSTHFMFKITESRGSSSSSRAVARRWCSASST